jgi:hypothetical protein
VRNNLRYRWLFLAGDNAAYRWLSSGKSGCKTSEIIVRRRCDAQALAHLTVVISHRRLAAISALANEAIPAAHFVGSGLIQVALIGFGGRGGGATASPRSVKRGPVMLVAIADMYQEGRSDELSR